MQWACDEWSYCLLSGLTKRGAAADHGASAASIRLRRHTRTGSGASCQPLGIDHLTGHLCGLPHVLVHAQRVVRHHEGHQGDLQDAARVRGTAV